MNSIPDTDVEPGQVLAGKFRIEKILGRGGMGVVVAATHMQLDERVALKFLLPEALSNKEAVSRFEREARAAVKIKSEHVARITDVGTLENGSPFMVMEYLNGMDLGQYLEKVGPLPVGEAILYLSQAAEAIAEAHSLGIVHRDLKPANLFRIMRSDGTPSIKVLDFGISKVTNGTDASMTQTSSMMGSPYYMSPEQMTSAKNVDHRTDVWALGIILHELLTGRVPYDGQTIPEVCAQVLQNPPPPLVEMRTDVPAGVQEVINTALAKKREERYQNVAELTAALGPYGSEESQRSVERISKVLGIAPTFSSTGMRESRAALANTAMASPWNKDVTLGGAAHTQADYVPPTNTRGMLPFALGAVVLLGGGLAFWAMAGTSAAPQEELIAGAASGSADVESLKVEEPEKPAAAEKAEEPKSAPEVAPEAAPVAKPAPEPAPAPRPAQAPRPAPVVAKPRPAPSKPPAPAPVAVPAPAPAPAPAPNPSSLYLDRK